MSFYQKYELVRLLEKGEADRFQALDRATKQAVFLHLLPASSQIANQLRAVRSSPKMIDFGEFAGFVYAVTDTVEPFTNILDYLAVTTVTIEQPTPPERATAAESTAGDFTQLFQVPRDASEPAERLLDDDDKPRPANGSHEGEFTRMFLAQRPPQEPGLLQDAKAEPAPQEGEFTRMFKSPLGASKGPDAEPLLNDVWEAPKPAAPPSTPAPTNVSEQGDFTRIFGPGMLTSPSPAPPPPPPAQAKSAPAGEPDGFTRQFFAERPKEAPQPLSDDFEKFFGPGLKSGSIDMDKQSPMGEQPPESRPFKAAGEFTRMFGKGELEKAAEPSLPTGDLSGIFAMPDLTKPKAKAPPPAEAQPDTPRREETMGEYTRIIKVGTLMPPPEVAPAPAAPAQASSDEAAAKRKKLMIFGIAIGIAVVVIAGIVLVLFLR